MYAYINLNLRPHRPVHSGNNRSRARTRPQNARVAQQVSFHVHPYSHADRIPMFTAILILVANSASFSVEKSSMESEIIELQAKVDPLLKLPTHTHNRPVVICYLHSHALSAVCPCNCTHAPDRRLGKQAQKCDCQ